MSKIRIIATPKGFASENIRRQWVGVEIPIATEEELAEDPPSATRSGNGNKGGHFVLRQKAVEALRMVGRHDAEVFWNFGPYGRYLQFAKDVCIVVKEPT